MPFSHKLSRALLSTVVLGALIVAGYVGYRHGAIAVQLTRYFVSTVRRIWS